MGRIRADPNDRARPGEPGRAQRGELEGAGSVAGRASAALGGLLRGRLLRPPVGMPRSRSAAAGFAACAGSSSARGLRRGLRGRGSPPRARRPRSSARLRRRGRRAVAGSGGLRRRGLRLRLGRRGLRLRRGSGLRVSPPRPSSAPPGLRRRRPSPPASASPRPSPAAARLRGAAWLRRRAGGGRPGRARGRGSRPTRCAWTSVARRGGLARRGRRLRRGGAARGRARRPRAVGMTACVIVAAESSWRSRPPPDVGGLAATSAAVSISFFGIDGIGTEVCPTACGSTRRAPSAASPQASASASVAESRSPACRRAAAARRSRAPHEPRCSRSAAPAHRRRGPEPAPTQRPPRPAHRRAGREGGRGRA